MSPADLTRLAFGAIAAQRVRTRLTIAAVAIGVASVLLLTALSEGARGYVTNQFSAIGSDVLSIMPGRVETSGGMPMAGASEGKLTLDDAAAIARLPRVREVIPAAIANAPVEFGGRMRHLTVFGSTPNILDLYGLSLAAGAGLPDIDPKRSVAVCLIGSKVRRELFGARNPLGEMLTIGDSRLRVIGLLAPHGHSFGINLDEIIIAPVANVLRIVNRSSLFRIAVRVRSFEQLDAATKDITNVLIDRHAGAEDFTIVTPKSMQESLDQILLILGAALTAIAGISLAVAGVLVMNVRLIAVVERTPEIGLFKALGASSAQILLLFLAESAVVTFLGGVVGVALGLFGVEIIVTLVPDLPARAPLWAIEAALGVAVGVGVLFGGWPALKAASLAPVAALRAKV